MSFLSKLFKKKNKDKEPKVVQEAPKEVEASEPKPGLQVETTTIEPAIEPKKPATPIKKTSVAKPKTTAKTNQTVKKEDEDKSKVAKYHVSQNKDQKSDTYRKWRVRKEGSTKTIKFFDTQKEAIAYAEQLAESAGASVVIHKMDGKVRKQNY
jgi:uncharacterized protein YdaT